MKLHCQEVKTCSDCSNLIGQVSPICKLLNDAIPINCNVYEQIYYRCPLPDADNIIEVMGNPNPHLTEKEERDTVELWHQVNRQDRDLTYWQQSVSRVLRKGMLPKHCRSSENPSV